MADDRDGGVEEAADARAARRVWLGLLKRVVVASIVATYCTSVVGWLFHVTLPPALKSVWDGFPMVVMVVFLASAFRSTLRTADIRRFLGLRGVQIGAVGLAMMYAPMAALLPLQSLLPEQWTEALATVAGILTLCGLVTLYVVAPIVGLLDAGNAELRAYQARYGSRRAGAEGGDGGGEQRR